MQGALAGVGEQGHFVTTSVPGARCPAAIPSRAPEGEVRCVVIPDKNNRVTLLQEVRFACMWKPSICRTLSAGTFWVDRQVDTSPPPPKPPEDSRTLTSACWVGG